MFRILFPFIFLQHLIVFRIIIRESTRKYFAINTKERQKYCSCLDISIRVNTVNKWF